MSEICTECLDGRVLPKTGEGRLFTYRRGSKYELPADFEVPTCDSCGAMFFDSALREAARETLKSACMDDQRSHLTFLVETIRAKAAVSNREIEQACGVTPTYLSHILKGRKEASEALVGLLEVFAVHPSEVRRRLNRASAYDTEGVKTAIRHEEMLWYTTARYQPGLVKFEFDPVPANDARAA